MTDSRHNILERLRQAQSAQRRPYPESKPPAQLSEQPLEDFISRAQELHSVVVQALEPEQLAQPVADIVRAQGYRLNGVNTLAAAALAPWQAAGFELHAPPVLDNDTIGLTSSELAIAETGTVVLTNLEAFALSASLAPTVHIALVQRSALVLNWEDALARLGPERSDRVHAISGPARTGDIEQTITLGAHGPRMVVIALWGRR